MFLFFSRVKVIFPFIWRFLNSKEVPLKSKLFIIFGSLYLVSFIDLIPDMIPLLGIADDAVITTAMMLLGYFGTSQKTRDAIWNLVTKKISYQTIK
ncbi:MAG: YkvA family protein [Patescibacteria group bacterium]